MSATNTVPKTVIGPFGITGGTGYFGYLSIGNLKPQSSVTPGSSLTLMARSNDGNLIAIEPNKMPDSINLKIESRTDQQIVFTFDYPPQVLIGSLLVPEINSFGLVINGTSGNINLYQTQPPYVKKDSSLPLQRIIIQNSNPNNTDSGIISKIYTIYYTDPSGTLKISYNDKTYSLPFSYSIPTNSNPTPILLTNLFGVTGVTGTYYSQYSDQTNTTSNLSYTLNIQSQSNSVCYGFLTGTTGITGSYQSGTGIFYKSDLIPETTYKMTASASNSIYNPNTGPTGITNIIMQVNSNGPTGGPTGYIDFTTPLFSIGLTGSDTNMNTKSTAATIEAKSLTDNIIYNIFKDDGIITSDTIPIPINYTSTRGKNSINISPLIKIYGSITNGSETYKTSDLIFGGFGDIENSTKSAQGINRIFTITSTKTDAYKGTSSEGFYLNADTVLSVPVTSLISINGLNTLTITATYPSLNNITKTYRYNNIRYDGPYSPATFFSANFSFNNTNITGRYICGIYTVQTLPTINFNATILNLGNYYYNSKKLLDFNVTTENDSISTSSPYFSIAPITTHPTPLPPVTTNLSSSVTFTNTLTLIQSQTQKVYSQYIRITPNAYSSIDIKSTGSGYYGYLPIIYDNSILITSIFEIINTSTSVEGCRVQTFLGGNTTITPFSPNNITNGLIYPYSDYPFNTPSNNQISLVNSSELLYANGMYVTPVTPGIKPEYYTSYDTIKFGNVDIYNPDYVLTNLTNISPIRYATFAWKTKVTNCNSIIFTLKNASRQITVEEFNNNFFTLYYRIEDSTSLTKLGLANSSQIDFNGNLLQNYYGTTNWIIGSPPSPSINTTYVLSTNYTNISLIFNGYNSSTFTTDLSFNVNLPSRNKGELPSFTPPSSSPPYYIYCRIAIDITKIKNFSFSNVTSQIST